MILKKYDAENYRVLLDERWTLENLNDFTRLYMQNYAFLYCLENNINNSRAAALFNELNEYKLRDGLTYVNIYSLFIKHIPSKERPKVRAISYASPGFIELILNYEVAINIALSIAAFIKGLTATAETYNKLHSIFIELGRKRKEKQNHLLKLDVETIKHVRKLNEELAKGLGFNSLKDMYDNFGDEEEVSKLLLAHYRRMKGMSKLVKEGKIKFPLE
ncbi:hypothetical protein [Acinetobacter faecalis]|uniref:Uncharacterized protein n=2 Tax=Acinetobacter faecalis TaxID=2665161 RepID=A0AB35UVC6_9GAMM|nr:hypothetical protein [Acinetobacter faecalis]MDY6460392.1 hypothetical protein [Acinetobacter faecalis]MDY6484081.1 hypothetical protein [Acinetobacter faecalis]MDY6487938.1 hypothetical protein [Acinetobacter faecalis]MDY6531460.1 hypothetical protein [Acinetobacter faecalis]